MTMAPRVDIATLRRMLDDGAQLVDALPAKDHEELHIKGAINVPIEDFRTELLELLDNTRPVVTSCDDTQ